MYLIVIAWVYVVLMMSVAEATNTTGSLLGAIMTFLLYGVLPLGIVVYVMQSPGRRRALKAREKAGQAETQSTALDQPDAGAHAPASVASDGPSQSAGAAVREKS
jgi:hypothetical protein